MKRPILLTIVLVLMVARSLLSILVFFSGTAVSNYLGDLSIIQPFTPYLLWSIAELIGVMMAWQWKKIGLYLLYATTIISPILPNPTQASVNYLTMLLFTGLGLGLLYFGSKPVWSKFK